MQLIIFDNTFKCMYRLRNIPSHGTFKEVYKVMQLSQNPDNYTVMTLSNDVELCIDEYVYEDERLKLTSTGCD